MSQNFNELIQKFEHEQTDHYESNNNFSKNSYSNQDYFQNFNDSYQEQTEEHVSQSHHSNQIFKEEVNDQTIKRMNTNQSKNEVFDFQKDSDDYFDYSDEPQYKLPNFNQESKISDQMQNVQLSESEEEKEDEYIDNLKICLKKIFSFYCSFGKRISNEKMNLSQFNKMCVDADLLDKNLDQQQIQLCFISVNKIQINLPYDKFPRLLHAISQIRYNFENPNENFTHLIEKNIMPLFNVIYSQTDMGTIDKILRSQMDFSILSLVYLVRKYFFQMYQKFFKNELENFIVIKQEKILKQSKEVLIKFLRDFELLPGLITINTVCEFYTAIMNLNFNDPSSPSIKDFKKILQTDHGHVFTFHRFFFFMLKISMFTFSDPNNIPKKFRLLNFTNEEKFYMLLERMEISQGFYDLSIKSSKKNQTPRLTFTTKQLSDLHKETGKFPNFEQYLVDNGSQSWMLLNFDFNVKSKAQKNYLFQQLNQQKQKSLSKSKEPVNKYNFNDDFIQTIMIFKKDLKKIYINYSTQKANQKKSTMNSFQFIRFLKDSKIVRQIHQQVNKDYTILTKDADLIFTQLTHHNSKPNRQQIKKKSEQNKVEVQSTIDFKGFLKALEILVYKLFPNESIKKGVDNLFYFKISKNLFKTNHNEQKEQLNMTVEKINQSDEYIKILSKNLQDKEVIALLGLIHSYMSPRFYVYTKKRPFMKQNEFFEFYKDYSIFPTVLSKVKLESIFDALSLIYQQNPDKKQQEDQIIDEHIFAESVVLIAHNLKLNLDFEPKIYQKITFLVDLMQESEGDEKTMMQNTTIRRVDVFAKLRIAKPNHFLMQINFINFKVLIMKSNFKFQIEVINDLLDKQNEGMLKILQQSKILRDKNLQNKNRFMQMKREETLRSNISREINQREFSQKNDMKNQKNHIQLSLSNCIYLKDKQDKLDKADLKQNVKKALRQRSQKKNFSNIRQSLQVSSRRDSRGIGLNLEEIKIEENIRKQLPMRISANKERKTGHFLGYLGNFKDDDTVDNEDLFDSIMSAKKKKQSNRKRANQSLIQTHSKFADQQPYKVSEIILESKKQNKEKKQIQVKKKTIKIKRKKKMS